MTIDILGQILTSDRPRCLCCGIVSTPHEHLYCDECRRDLASAADTAPRFADDCGTSLPLSFFERRVA